VAEYEDDTIVLDELGLTIKNYMWPGRSKFLAYERIRSAQPIELRIGTGRWRLVGISPGRLRTFFHWDRNRAGKSSGINLDVGRWLHRAITPDRPEEVMEILSKKIDATR
jgi:hypothetical protein